MNVKNQKKKKKNDNDDNINNKRKGRYGAVRRGRYFGIVSTNS